MLAEETVEQEGTVSLLQLLNNRCMKGLTGQSPKIQTTPTAGPVIDNSVFDNCACKPYILKNVACCVLNLWTYLVMKWEAWEYNLWFCVASKPLFPSRETPNDTTQIFSTNYLIKPGALAGRAPPSSLLISFMLCTQSVSLIVSGSLHLVNCVGDTGLCVKQQL